MKTMIPLTLTAFLAVGCTQESGRASNTEATDVKASALYTKVTSSKAFSQSVRLTHDEEDLRILGKSFFSVPWVEAPSATTARDGLGPLFSANTCKHCHPNNGAGVPTDANGNVSRALVMRLSLSNIKNINNDLIVKNGFAPEPVYGGQLSVNGTSDVDYEGRVEVRYEAIEGRYADGTAYELQNPSYILSDLNYGAMNAHVNVAPHIALALIGLGHIEQIADAEILKNEDVNDSDNDGISGKANWVYSPETNTTQLGRYTWKAAAASVRHQSANAALNDMGLTNPLYPNENCTASQADCREAPKGRGDFDLTAQRLDAIAFYLRSLKIPAQRHNSNFEAGEKIFKSLSCTGCHVERFTTREGVEIYPYSDFLLHDMGEALGDGHTMFMATQTEFRTPPLWGIGLYEKVSGDLALLHDGRARTVEEAILWHDGEARQHKEAFKTLSRQERQTLVDFIKGI